MEQKKINIVIVNDNKNNTNDNKSGEEAVVEDQEEGFLGVLPIHSQVMKIKREIGKIKYPFLQQQEMRRVLLRANYRPQRSRSPLGLAERKGPISVHN